MAMPLVKRTKARAALRDLRAAYDESIAEAGLVLVQQTAVGADAHHVSLSCIEVLGWDPAAFLNAGTLRSIVHTNDLALFRTAATNPDDEAAVIRLRRADGSYGHFRFGTSVRSIDQPLTFALVDVSKDARARAVRSRAAEMVDRSDSAVIILNLADPGDPGTFEIEDVNPAAARLLRQESLSRLDEVFADDTRELLHNAAFDVAHTGEDIAFTRLEISELPDHQLDVRLARLADGTIALHIDDVTMQFAFEQRLRERALHDQRTGLANLAALGDELIEVSRDLISPDKFDTSGAIVPPVGAGTLLGMLAIDLASPGVEDGLILEVAQRLCALRAPEAFVARVGEQRLAVLVNSLTSDEELEVLVQSATASLAVPFDIDGQAVAVHAVLGAASSNPVDAPVALLRDAEDALRRAVAQHRPWVIGSMDDRAAPAGLFQDVRDGVGHGRMELRYQPILDLHNGRITKVEALLRWADGSRQPDASLELAERSGIPDVLPHWVIGEAAGAARWLVDSGFDQTVAINLGNASAVGGLEGLLGLLAAEGMFTHGRIEVEVPESLITDDPIAASEMIAELHDLGMSVAIDDFGVGYTSLSSVSGLGVDSLKIDRSFIATLSSIPADEAVVRSTIELCHQIGIVVGALGVPDDDTVEALRAMGCDMAQGSAICEPVALEELPTRIADIQRSLV